MCRCRFERAQTSSIQLTASVRRVPRYRSPLLCATVIRAVSRPSRYAARPSSPSLIRRPVLASAHRLIGALVSAPRLLAGGFVLASPSGSTGYAIHFDNLSRSARRPRTFQTCFQSVASRMVAVSAMVPSFMSTSYIAQGGESSPITKKNLGATG